MTNGACVRQLSLLTILTVLTVLAGASWAVAQEGIEPPANAPATAEWNAAEGRLGLRYHGTTILDATIGAEDAEGREVKGMQPCEELCC